MPPTEAGHQEGGLLRGWISSTVGHNGINYGVGETESVIPGWVDHYLDWKGGPREMVMGGVVANERYVGPLVTGPC